MKIGVVIVKVATRYAGKNSYDWIYKTYINPNWIAPINISFKSKTNLLKLYAVNDVKKMNAIKVLIRLTKPESTPESPYFMIPNENDQRIDTIMR